MGLLTLGTPLKWNDSAQYLEHVHEHGIEQLINIYRRSVTLINYKLLWGDEIEYMVVVLDDEHQLAKLSLRQSEILSRLESIDTGGSDEDSVVFHPEYGRYMLEATPAHPFSGDFVDLLKVERNMHRRRALAKQVMRPEECPLTVTSFPMLGVTDEEFTDPHYEANGEASRSLFLPDEIINTHVRFPTLTANIRRRRGKKVAINIPIFRDTETPQPFVDPTIPWDRQIFPTSDQEAKQGAALADHIYMDSMGFGMGCCCLQITFQARDIDEARLLYDYLAPLTPIMMALTAASPAYRGYLSDQDARWNVIAMSVDDRTDKEMEYMSKSRYDSIDSYLTEGAQVYNDTKLIINEKVKKRLLEAGFDGPLANHFAHLFIRDPLVIFEESINQDDSVDTDHFENIQSTNWQTMRFKPPPPPSPESSNPPIGWRVEFRSMEIQPTDFENAAFAVFVVLVTRVILSYNLNLLMPISKVDQNMRVAHYRNAVLKNKFWFRRNIQEPDTVSSGSDSSSLDDVSVSSHVTGANSQASSVSLDSGIDSETGESINSAASSATAERVAVPVSADSSKSLSSVEGFDTRVGLAECHQMTCDEIINGSASFIGLVPLIKQYLRSMNVDIHIYCKLSSYLDLVSARASGAKPTTATVIRDFIMNHPDYKHDSKITGRINYDLMKMFANLESCTSDSS